jgi:hypothetical protein
MKNIARLATLAVAAMLIGTALLQQSPALADPRRPAVERSLPTAALLDSLQRTGFLYFWEQVNPVNGLIRDRSQSWSPCSIAAQGFGISVICIGIDHGWVSREAGRERIRLGMQTLWDGPQGDAISAPTATGACSTISWTSTPACAPGTASCRRSTPPC